MIKTFHIQSPLSLEDSFDLVFKSGNSIMFWQTTKSDFENRVIVWKQNIFSLTGSAGITARFEDTKKNETLVVVEINKPFQIMDPVKLCEKVFRKLDDSWKKNLKALKNGEN